MSEQNQETQEVEKCPEYVSFRVTCGHNEWDTIVKEILYDEPIYVAYPHVGKNGNNPHFHVFVPGDKPKSDKLRNRLKKSSFSGNKQYSLKCMQNGILRAITYGSREGTEAIIRGEQASDWITAAPKWINANLKENMTIAGNKRKRDENGEKLTPENLLFKAWKYREAKVKMFGESDDKTRSVWAAITDMSTVVLHMLEDGHYFSNMLLKQGVPDFYQDVFKDSCKVGRLQWKSQQKRWENVIFRRFE
tara:strand:- start:67 stop:810 length:744 start_codon:yes stop_codon:yes gene_type:complete